MKQTLQNMFDGQSLSRDDAHRILLNISDGLYNDAQLAAFMTVFLMRPITTDELAGFRDALLERRRPVDLGDEYDAIDIVGTGGDGHNTFNISTCTCFVVAGAGFKVVKHGNYGASSVSGASTVLELHGIKFSGEPDQLRRSLDGSGVAFLHAPLFSPALKSVGPVRKALAVRSFFNMLGPLVNPTLPRHQLLGVYNLKLLRLYNYIAQQEGIRCTIVHSLDGYDEISLTSPFKVADSATGRETILTAASLGLPEAKPEELYGGSTPSEAAEVFDMTLRGEGPRARRDVVTANAAFAIHTLRPDIAIDEALGLARTSLESGAALDAFKKFVNLNS